MVPVSHPERGFDVIDKKNLNLWKQWGWQEESWDMIADEPAGVRKATEGKPKVKRTKKANPGTEENNAV